MFYKVYKIFLLTTLNISNKTHNFKRLLKKYKTINSPENNVKLEVYIKTYKCHPFKRESILHSKDIFSSDKAPQNRSHFEISSPSSKAHSTQIYCENIKYKKKKKRGHYFTMLSCY